MRWRQRRELEAKATRILRVAGRGSWTKASSVSVRPRVLPPVWPDHLRLQDLAWVMKQKWRR